LLNVNKAYDGVIDIKFNGENYYSLYALAKTIEKDGIEQNAGYIYYTGCNSYLGKVDSIINNVKLPFSR